MLCCKLKREGILRVGISDFSLEGKKAVFVGDSQGLGKKTIYGWKLIARLEDM